MAAGRVTTGFSKPYVALYAVTGTTVTYSSGVKLARGVSVAIEVDEASGENNMYCDNTIAEAVAGAFGGGTATLTVDGLKDAVRKLILGLPAADTEGFTHYGDSMSVPYVGIGYIARVQSDGIVSYVPTILRKAKFNVPSLNAATQEEEIEWQTEELTATLLRDDSADHSWLWMGEEEDTEADAEDAIKAVFSIT